MKDSLSSGEIGLMGIEGGVELVYKKELEAETDPENCQILFNTLMDRAHDAGNVEPVAIINGVIDATDKRHWVVNSWYWPVLYDLDKCVLP